MSTGTATLICGRSAAPPTRTYIVHYMIRWTPAQGQTPRWAARPTACLRLAYRPTPGPVLRVRGGAASAAGGPARMHSTAAAVGSLSGLGAGGRKVINCVLGIQYLNPCRGCTLFLLLRRLSSGETMSTRLTHNLGCNYIWNLALHDII